MVMRLVISSGTPSVASMCRNMDCTLLWLAGCRMNLFLQESIFGYMMSMVGNYSWNYCVVVSAGSHHRAPVLVCLVAMHLVLIFSSLVCQGAKCRWWVWSLRDLGQVCCMSMYLELTATCSLRVEPQCL